MTPMRPPSSSRATGLDCLRQLHWPKTPHSAPGFWVFPDISLHARVHPDDRNLVVRKTPAVMRAFYLLLHYQPIPNAICSGWGVVMVVLWLLLSS